MNEKRWAKIREGQMGILIWMIASLIVLNYQKESIPRSTNQKNQRENIIRRLLSKNNIKHFPPTLEYVHQCPRSDDNLPSKIHLEVALLFW